ncbi:MAG: hypothetical protein SGCHY_001215 [Lobulomycetales sp.]
MPKKGKKQQYLGNIRKLPNGISGITVNFTQNREKGARREFLALLNRYADILYGPEKHMKEHAPMIEEAGVDIEDAIRAEVCEIKEKSRSSAHRRFNILQTFGCNIFVKVDRRIVDPVRLVEFIVQGQTAAEGAGDTKQSDKAMVLQYLHRLEPIVTTTFADIDKITQVVEEQLRDSAFVTGKSFSVGFKSRNSTMVDRKEVIDAVGATVAAHDASLTVDLETPDFVVFVSVWFSTAGVSILSQRYTQSKKYALKRSDGE